MSNTAVGLYLRTSTHYRLFFLVTEIMRYFRAKFLKKKTTVVEVVRE